MQVVDGIQARAEYLAEPVQVMQVGAAEVAAGVTLAIFDVGGGMQTVLGGLDPDVGMAGGKRGGKCRKTSRAT